MVQIGGHLVWLEGAGNDRSDRRIEERELQRRRGQRNIMTGAHCRDSTRLLESFRGRVDVVVFGARDRSSRIKAGREYASDHQADASLDAKRNFMSHRLLFAEGVAKRQQDEIHLEEFD